MQPTQKTVPAAGRNTSRIWYFITAVALLFFGSLLSFQSFLIITANKAYDDRPSDDSPNFGGSNSAHTETAAAFDIQQFAKAFTESLSSNDGIYSNERIGFNITLSDPKSNFTCGCDIISTDCLDTIACMQDLHSSNQRHALTWMGIELRRSMKTTSEESDEAQVQWWDIPLGKNLQYNTINVWLNWRKRDIWVKYSEKKKQIFIKEDWYPDCLDDHGGNFTSVKYNGLSCFYRSPIDPEDSAGTLIEDEANRWYDATIESRNSTQRQIYQLFSEFLRDHQPYPMEIGENTVVPKYDLQYSSFGNLIMFAHVTRMMFNRRPFLDKIYQEKLTNIATPGSEIVTNGATYKGKTHKLQNDKDPFIVSLHMRRGDSCGDASPLDYQREASKLDSRAQHGGERKCYKTAVYLNAVKRIRSLVPMTRPIHVYLATDDVGNVIHEILNMKQKKLDEDEIVYDNAYGVEKWHFLNYSRAHFDYKADSIEDEENTENQPILGETAVADLWLLSHGHAFVGHMGSRFGKVSWLLATARRNNFIPFFSVDGHSKCSCFSLYLVS